MVSQGLFCRHHLLSFSLFFCFLSLSFLSYLDHCFGSVAIRIVIIVIQDASQRAYTQYTQCTTHSQAHKHPPFLFLSIFYSIFLSFFLYLCRRQTVLLLTSSLLKADDLRAQILERKRKKERKTKFQEGRKKSEAMKEWEREQLARIQNSSKRRKFCSCACVFPPPTL